MGPISPGTPADLASASCLLAFQTFQPTQQRPLHGIGEKQSMQGWARLGRDGLDRARQG